MTQPEEYYSCERKKGYRTEKIALDVFKKIKKSGQHVPSTAGTYFCKYCNKWHITKNIVPVKDRPKQTATA